ncbi:MAG: spore germination protein GerW family protein [Eubacteriales bacterium]
MEKNHHVEELLGNTIETLKGLLGNNTLIGAPIETQGVTLIPVSKLSVGVGGGGSDYISKNQKAEQGNSFGGGAAASAKMEPVAFLVVRGNDVKVLHMTPPPASVADRIIDAAPDLMDKLAEFLENQKEKKEEKKDFVKEK